MLLFLSLQSNNWEKWLKGVSNYFGLWICIYYSTVGMVTEQLLFMVVGLGSEPYVGGSQEAYLWEEK